MLKVGCLQNYLVLLLLSLSFPFIYLFSFSSFTYSSISTSNDAYSSQAATYSSHVLFERQFSPLFIQQPQIHYLTLPSLPENEVHNSDQSQSTDFRRPERTTTAPVVNKTVRPIKLQQAPSRNNQPKLQPFLAPPKNSFKQFKTPVKVFLKPIEEPSFLNQLARSLQIKKELLLQHLNTPRYVIEKILYSPPHHIAGVTSLKNYHPKKSNKITKLIPKRPLPLKYIKHNQPFNGRPEKLKASVASTVTFTTPRTATTNQNFRIIVPSTEENAQQRDASTPDRGENDVKVDAVNKVSADKPIRGYEAYFPGNGEKSTLIFEPQATSIASNDGVAIANPVSRALIRKGSNTKVLWKPQAVAISGARGKSHAEAELIVDYFE